MNKPINDNGIYRYSLVREWLVGDGILCYIMLNPSTANVLEDDNTLIRCSGFARQWGFAKMRVVNLFAIRSTDPKKLKEFADPIGGIWNDATIRTAVKAAKQVIVAWGNHGSLHGRDKEVLKILKTMKIEPMCLGITKSGAPKHPLYLPDETELVPFKAPVPIPSAK